MPEQTFTSARSAGASPFAAAAAAFARMVRAVRREAEIERARRALATMSDAMLKDMGIDRGQIDLAARYGRGAHGRRRH